MSIKKIIAIAATKGGVGKSIFSAGLALNLLKKYKVGILDADIYGPNQHIIFNTLDKKIEFSKDSKKILPININGLLINSMGYIVDQDIATTWRGPMLSSAIRKLITETDWGDLDYLIIDMPPGTGDSYLTIASETHDLDTILITSKNKLSYYDLKKTISMMKKLNINILGYVENNIFNYKGPLIDEESLEFKKLGQIDFSDDLYNLKIENALHLFDDITMKIIE